MRRLERRVAARDARSARKRASARIDALVHSIAFANKEDLAGKVFDTSRAGFSLALDVSAYSLIALVSALRETLNDGASIMALTYLGATPNRSELQPDGHREGRARGDGALSRLRSRRARHSRQRDFGRSDQDGELATSRRILAHPRHRAEGRAAAPQRYARGRRQHGGLPCLRSRERRDGRRAFRRRGVPRDGIVR